VPEPMAPANRERAGRTSEWCVQCWWQPERWGATIFYFELVGNLSTVAAFHNAGLAYLQGGATNLTPST